MVKTHDIIYGSVLAAADRQQSPPRVWLETANGPTCPKGKGGYIKASEEKQILQSMKNISVDSDRIWYNITTKDFHMNSHSNKLGISRKGANERRGGTGETSGTSGTGETGETGGTSGTSARPARPARHSSHHHSAERINQ